MSQPVIEINDLSFWYDKKKVLKDIKLKLNDHGFYIFLGPNGGGKTTLIKLIMGILQPRRGSVKIYGENPKNVRGKIGYIPQKLEFDPIFPITLFEFLQQGLLSNLPWHGKWPQWTFVKVEEMLKRFSLEDLKKRSMGELSGGQLQRSIIARALISDPDILILDEPLSGLDHKATKNIISLIEQMQGKKTIILITHVITHLLKKADSVYLIEKTMSPLKDEALCKHMELGLFHTEEEGCDHE
ncbi:MAG: High-affinity zinc uptake system ATP-binding protein ZnuC [Chlamydiia bacterium]|nr:High-affinity zinc uptake system ATP-binding protein ZnuC [Chlamydiia bacterium]